MDFEHFATEKAIGPVLAPRVGAMDPMTAMAASGLRARMESLELLANNVANASTGGYKADRECRSAHDDER